MRTAIAAAVAALFLAGPVLAAAGETPAAAQGEAKVVIPVAGMHCGGCAQNVDKAVTALSGVKSSDTDVDKAETTVTYDAGKVKVDAIRKAIEKAGYKPGAPKA
jgi:copper chaperone